MIFLQSLTQYKEILAVCQQILACVQHVDPAVALLLQQEVASLRWKLAEISLQSSLLRQRVRGIIDKL